VGVIAVGYLLYGIGRLRDVLGGADRRPAPPPALTKPAPPRRLIVAASVGALLVAVSTGAGLIWSADGRGSGARAAQDWAAAVDEVGAARELWRTTQGAAPNAQPARDHWVTDTHIVRRLPGRVVAHDLNTGDVAWEVPLPGDASDDCPSSQQQSGNRVALLRGPGGDASTCDEVTVLDIGAGKEVFTADLPPIDGKPVTVSDVPVVFGEFVLVSSPTGGHLVNAATGRHVPVADEGQCREDAYAAFADLLLARVNCRERPGSDPILTGLRAYNGELDKLWTWQAPEEGAKKPLAIRNVLSAEPLVVDVYRKSTDTVETLRVNRETNESVTLLSRQFTLRDGNSYLSPCDERGIAHCQQVRIADGKLILTTVPEQMNPDSPGAYPGMESTEFRNELVALDLETGREAWRTGMVDGRALHLVPTTDGSVVAYQSANANDVHGLLLSVDAATGAPKPLLPIGTDAHEDEELSDHVRSGLFGGDNQQALWANGRFIIFRTLYYTSNTGQAEMVAFGLPR
jgi:outer membrane protein assembly factor BamB